MMPDDWNGNSFDAGIVSAKLAVSVDAGLQLSMKCDE